jgi:hypothetical protein
MKERVRTIAVVIAAVALSAGSLFSCGGGTVVETVGHGLDGNTIIVHLSFDGETYEIKEGSGRKTFGSSYSTAWIESTPPGCITTWHSPPPDVTSSDSVQLGEGGSLRVDTDEDDKFFDIEVECEPGAFDAVPPASTLVPPTTVLESTLPATPDTTVATTSTTLPPPAPVLDLSGQWSWGVIVTSSDCGDGNEGEGSSETVTITHDLSSDAITIRGLLGAPDNELHGSVQRVLGSPIRVTVSGSYPEDDGVTTVRAITLTLSDDRTTLEGREAWAWDATDYEFTCSGRSDILSVLQLPGG